MRAPHSGTLLEDFIAIENQLQSDSNLSYETLQKRDRKIGQDSRHLKKRPLKQLRYWLDKTKSKDDSPNLGQVNKLISWALILSGLILGGGLARAIFNYDGNQPINVINLLVVAVGLQLFMLILLLISWLPRQVSKTIPGLGLIHQLLAGLSPAKWATRLAEISPKLHTQLQPLLQDNSLSNKDNIIKWQLSYWSQLFALAFNIALIAACFYLVASRDLAFGWSSTLDIQTLDFKSVTDLLSRVWKSFLPEAVPSLNLIESTRFYRLGTSTFANESRSAINQAHTAGQWWSFILLCLGFYGLLPRLIALLISKYRLCVNINQSLMGLPQTHLTFDRMNRPTVQTLAEEPEMQAIPAKINKVTNQTALFQRELFIYHWGQPAINIEQLSQWVLQGAQCQIKQFQVTAVDSDPFLPPELELPTFDSPNQALVIVVKAWEPPTLELTDWLSELRKNYGAKRLVAVVPYNINDLSELSPAGDSDCQMWCEFLARNGSHHVELHKI